MSMSMSKDGPEEDRETIQVFKNIIEKLKRKSLEKNLMDSDEIEAFDLHLTKRIKEPLDAALAIRNKEAYDNYWTIDVESEIREELEYDLKLWYQKASSWIRHYNTLKDEQKSSE